MARNDLAGELPDLGDLGDLDLEIPDHPDDAG
jgi:hypothetical protein